MSDVLEINVGGFVYTACRSTLCSVPYSLLAKMFDADTPYGPLKTDSSGRPYLDRNGETFAYVLDFLRRGGQLVGLPRLSEQTLEKLFDDAQFYGLEAMTTALKDHKQKGGSLATNKLRRQWVKTELNKIASEQGWSCYDKEIPTGSNMEGSTNYFWFTF